MTQDDIEARIRDLRALREKPSVEAAQDLLERWPDNFYDARSTGWIPQPRQAT